MYAGAPKFGQELFFWSYHLGSVHPAKENIFLLKNIDTYNYTAVEGGWGGGVVGFQKFYSTFSGNFYSFRLFKSPGKKFSVQRHNKFSKAIHMEFYAVLSHFAKCRDLGVKVPHPPPLGM